MAPSPPAPAPLSRADKLFTLAGTLLGMLLSALDQTIVATAGPLIARDLAIAPALYAWITTAYLVSSTVLVPIWGKLSDLLGRKPILLAGMSVFLAGSAACGLAGDAIQLIVARAVQGAGAAALLTTALAVIADLFPPAERGKYQGLFGAVWGVSSVVGPLAGGFITDHLGWHWAFFVNLPIGLLAMLFITARMPAIGRRAGPVSLDVAGAGALVVAVVPLLLALSVGEGEAPSGGTVGTGALALLALSLAGLVAFLWVERRAAEPILDLRLFRNRTFALGNGAAFAIGMAFLSSVVFLPLFMVNVVGMSATHAGLTTTPLTLGVVAGNVLTGQIVARTGRYKLLMVAGLVLLTVALVVMGTTLSPESGRGELVAKMVLVGLGLGPSIPLYTVAIQNAAPPDRIGVATSATTFFRSMGSTIGVAVVGSVFAAAFAGAAAAGAPGELGERLAWTVATERVYQVNALFAIVALLLTLALPEVPLRRTAEPPHATLE